MEATIVTGSDLVEDLLRKKIKEYLIRGGFNLKIAIPVSDKSAQATIFQSFGRAPYFMITDTETNERVFLDNTAADSQGGAGIKAVQIIIDKNIDVLFTPRCGENAAEVLREANVKIYKTINESVEDNVNAFNLGQLSLLDYIHLGFHGHEK